MKKILFVLVLMRGSFAFSQQKQQVERIKNPAEKVIPKVKEFSQKGYEKSRTIVVNLKPKLKKAWIKTKEKSKKVGKKIKRVLN